MGNYLNEIYTLLKLHEEKERMLFENSEYDPRNLRGSPKFWLDAANTKRKYRGGL
jgi:hypothetical protein